MDARARARVRQGQKRPEDQRDQWEGMPAMRQTATVLYELCRQQALEPQGYVVMLNNTSFIIIIIWPTMPNPQ